MNGKVFIISGPSGVGKTTVVEGVISSWSNKSHPLERVVTYTTRAARPHEVDGKDYHFITMEEFLLKREQGFFLETSTFCGHSYGSARSVLEKVKMSLFSYLLILDQEGARALKSVEGIVLIWLMPPTLDALRDRLEKRAEDSREVIMKRIEKAQREVTQEKKDMMYDYHVINTDLKDTINTLKCLIEAIIGSVHKE